MTRHCLQSPLITVLIMLCWVCGCQAAVLLSDYRVNGISECPSGTSRITSQLDCENAALSLGMTFRDAASQPNRIPGCWLYTSGYGLKWNPNVGGCIGSAEWGEHVYCKVGKMVCKQARTTVAPTTEGPTTEACPWQSGNTDSNNKVLCTDGAYVTNWQCGKGGHGQRLKCPPNAPKMCASKVCGAGMDHCCEAACDVNPAHGGERPCPQAR